MDPEAKRSTEMNSHWVSLYPVPSFSVSWFKHCIILYTAYTVYVSHACFAMWNLILYYEACHIMPKVLFDSPYFYNNGLKPKKVEKNCHLMLYMTLLPFPVFHKHVLFCSIYVFVLMPWAKAVGWLWFTCTVLRNQTEQLWNLWFIMWLRGVKYCRQPDTAVTLCATIKVCFESVDLCNHVSL